MKTVFGGIYEASRNEIIPDIEIISQEKYKEEQVVIMKTETYGDEIKHPVLVDDIVIKILSYLELFNLIAKRRINKTFRRNVELYLKGRYEIKSSFYKRLIQGNFLKTDIFKYKTFKISHELYTFVVLSYVEVIDQFPVFLASLSVCSCVTYDAIFLFLSFLWYLNINVGSARYFYYLDFYCKALRDKWKWLMYVIFGSDCRYNCYFDNDTFCSTYRAAFIKKNGKSIAEDMNFLTVKKKTKILAYYGMEEIYKKKCLRLIESSKVLSNFSYRSACCLTCPVRKKRSQYMRNKGIISLIGFQDSNLKLCY